MKYAKTIPAILVSHIQTTDAIKQSGIYNVTFSAIENYHQALAEALTPIVTSPLILKNAKEAEITVFRGKPGIQEHYLITIGKPAGQEAPVVRIHSSCFTGDLLGSMKCDCGEQLQESLHYMSANEGGYVIYLNQEGRGIGLANKLRAYALQAEGMDTVQANEYLGFEDDERPFLPAVYMLKNIGVDSVKLITNNPRKVKDLEEAGIVVAERLPIIIEPHEHNDDYLKTKFTKLGHLAAS
jgi:GTP cyclohydrolase II